MSVFVLTCYNFKMKINWDKILRCTYC